MTNKKNRQIPKITQIMPAPENMYAAFEMGSGEDKEISYSKIVCLALADDGEVYSMDTDGGGIIAFVENVGNFIGIQWGLNLEDDWVGGQNDIKQF